MNGSTPTPAWLKLSHSFTHLNSVLTTLASRERTRESARRTSRHKADPSKFHRSTHLSSILPKSSHVDHFSVSVGYQRENQPANRYYELEPYNRTRVIVGEAERRPSLRSEASVSPSANGRYINASWVRELWGGKWWIATQAPLPNTANAFLSLILQPVTRPPAYLDSEPSQPLSKSRVRTVVQLTQNIESGRQKAHIYFPSEVGESWIIPAEIHSGAPSVKVTLLGTKVFKEAHCIQSTVSVQPISFESPERSNGEAVTFNHLLYTSWPDHGVPDQEDQGSLLKFIRLVDKTNRDIPSSSELDPDPPIMVGCSAGIGRTGSFIALSSILRAYNLLSPSAASTQPPSRELHPLSPSPLGPLPNELKEDLVAQEIDSLREQRPAMVQREEQVLLIYELLAAAFADRHESQ